MRWVVFGSPSPAVADALLARGDVVSTLAELGLTAGASARDVLDAARKGQLDICTTDPAVADAASDARPLHRSILYLQLEGGDVEQDDAIDRLFKRYKRLAPNRLYTVTGTRVKVRQLPGA